MRWIKATQIIPDGIHKKKYHVKYKGSPEILVFINSTWYWFDNGMVESQKYPVHTESWQVIEFLDESDEWKDSEMTDKDLIIYGIQEGCDLWQQDAENWKFKFEKALQALNNLVTLKYIKEEHGETEHYLAEKPKAWELAKATRNAYFDLLPQPPKQ